MIPLNKVVSYLDENIYLINMIEPFLDKGYSTMYIWEDNNKINVFISDNLSVLRLNRLLYLNRHTHKSRV